MCSEESLKPKVAVSISVPIYNAEKYLPQCIDSLVNQTLENIEIILVDDGSTDSSGLMCDRYAERDSRIKVVHKKNGGLASARQVGLEEASGDFFCVCDADDWVELTMYEELYKKAVEASADIVMCDYFAEYGNGITRASCYGREISKNNKKLIDDALNSLFPCSVWSKMYKREIFEKYNLIWEPGINMGEDFLMTLKILQNPVQIVYLPMNLYHYRRMPGEDSYTNHVTLSSYNQMLRIQEWIEDNFNRSLYGKGICHYLIDIAFAGLRVVDGMTTEYYRKTSTKRLSIRSLLKENTLKSWVILWTKIFGYHAGLAVYHTMYKRFYK